MPTRTDYMLWPEESARSVTLTGVTHIRVRSLWPEESARSVTLFSLQPARLARVAALLALEKHELDWCGLCGNAGFSDEDLHLAKLPIGHGHQSNLPLLGEFGRHKIAMVRRGIFGGTMPSVHRELQPAKALMEKVLSKLGVALALRFRLDWEIKHGKEPHGFVSRLRTWFQCSLRHSGTQSSRSRSSPARTRAQLAALRASRSNSVRSSSRTV